MAGLKVEVYRAGTVLSDLGLLGKGQGRERPHSLPPPALMGCGRLILVVSRFSRIRPDQPDDAGHLSGRCPGQDDESGRGDVRP